MCVVMKKAARVREGNGPLEKVEDETIERLQKATSENFQSLPVRDDHVMLCCIPWLAGAEENRNIPKCGESRGSHRGRCGVEVGGGRWSWHGYQSQKK